MSFLPGRTTRGALFLLSGYVLSACSALASGPSVELRGQHFNVELATDDASRAMGLMYRDSMPADHGSNRHIRGRAPPSFGGDSRHNGSPRFQRLSAPGRASSGNIPALSCAE